MCAFFSNLFNAPTEPKAKEFKDPVFLIGLMRSGTTFLMNTLSEHPQLLKVGFELNKVWTEIGGAPCSVNCKRRTDGDFEQKYGNNLVAYFTRFIEESKTMKRHFARWSAKRYYGSGRVFYDWDNVQVLNKSPHLSNKILYLNRMFPKAKYVAVIREPYAHAASLKVHLNKFVESGRYQFYLPNDGSSCWTNIAPSEAKNFPEDRLYPNNFNLLLEYWLRLNTAIVKDIKEINPENYVIISYEDLVQKQESTLGQVFETLNLSNKHHEKEQAIFSRKRNVQNTSTKGNPLNKWKNQLSIEEISKIDEFVKEHEMDLKVILK